jgi:cobalamin biosynthesis Mg chelatase CobN
MQHRLAHARSANEDLERSFSMKRNVLCLFLTLLLAAALAVVAQSPTSSAPPGGSETKDPYGATLDHPNPNSGAAAQQPATTTSTPATATTSPTMSSTTSSSTTTDTSVSSVPSTSTTDTSGAANDATAKPSLPRTASELPLLATIGLLALGGALMVRSLAKRNTY